MTDVVTTTAAAGPTVVGDVLLAVRDLSVTYAMGSRRVHAATEVHLDLRKGEILGIIGETGSGKSTVARTLLGLLPHNAQLAPPSSVMLRTEAGAQVELARLPARKWMDIRGSVVGFVPQATSGALNPTLTVWQHFSSTLARHRGRGHRQGYRELAVTVLSSVGLKDAERILASYPHQLSGGMAQRVVLALAVVLEPQLLVADEPTSGLDASVRRHVLEALKASAASRGLGIVLVSHDIGIVANYCDRVVVMYGGFVVEGGSTAQVLGQPAHPYTAALLGALPRRGHALTVLPGAVGDLLDSPKGCPFYHRCTGDQDPRCADIRPPVRALANSHWVASFCEPRPPGAQS